MEPLTRLAEVVGPSHLITEPEQTLRYIIDERSLYKGRPLAVIRPGSTSEVSHVVSLCDEYDIAMVPQGGNTGYCGGATPDDSGQQIVISLERLNRIRNIDTTACTMVLDAGVVLHDVHEAARKQGLLFPLSMGSERSCQIGGNLSTNAGGVSVLKYGMARELVLGLEVVLPNGHVLDQLSVLRKDNTGYDLKQLFIGAEGTLGIITQAALRLYPDVPVYGTAWVAVTDMEAACTLLAKLRAASGDALTSFEYMSLSSLNYVFGHFEKAKCPLPAMFGHHILIEWATLKEGGQSRAMMEVALEEALNEGLVLDAVIAQTSTQRQSLWQIRESIPEAEKHLGGSIKHDVSVPISDLANYVTRAQASVNASWPDARFSIYGHVGDGNVHFNVLPPINSHSERFKSTHGVNISHVLHELAHELNGSFSAEHGIGKLKKRLLVRYSQPVALDLMRTIKQSLDPKGLMNPGKLVDCGEQSECRS